MGVDGHCGPPGPEFQPGPGLVENNFAGAGFWNFKMPGPSPTFQPGPGFAPKLLLKFGCVLYWLTLSSCLYG